MIASTSQVLHSSSAYLHCRLLFWLPYMMLHRFYAQMMMETWCLSYYALFGLIKKSKYIHVYALTNDPCLQTLIWKMEVLEASPWCFSSLVSLLGSTVLMPAWPTSTGDRYYPSPINTCPQRSDQVHEKIETGLSILICIALWTHLGLWRNTKSATSSSPPKLEKQGQ